VHTLLLPVESTICPSTDLLSSTLIRRLRIFDIDKAILNISLDSTTLSFFTDMFADVVLSPGLNVTIIALESKSEVPKVYLEIY